MKNGHRKMSKRMVILLIFVTSFTLFLQGPNISAAKKSEPKVLVIYTSKDGKVDEYQRSLDMIISHFTTDVTFISSSEVGKQDLTAVTHLFYYGQVASQLPPAFVNLFDDYEGTFVAIGYNSDQLGDQFSFINPLHEREINQLTLTSSKEKKLDLDHQNIVDTQLTKNAEILLEGKKVGDTTAYPVMVKKQNHYYCAFDSMSSRESILFGEVLHDIFQPDHTAKHPAYIRLEDVHPLVDPKNIKEIAKVLKEKNIPYMVAVIPVYINPETGKKYHFSDSPELLKVLKEMQKDGGSIVLHGYTHQFRASETGEGFEFWDVEHNRPIYAAADKPFTLRKESDFGTKAAYENYLNKLQKHERKYIETKLTKGIQELASYGLYPLAFEAPHYTMSQNGYQVVSEYFSTYVGQVQLSDENWGIMDGAPYITSPSFLNGMQLLPETLGYVRPDDPKAVQNIMKEAEIMKLTEDGMLAAFYHPYLGVDGFKKLIEEMEKQPNISWIDLKQMDVQVKADKVGIYTENGEIKVDIDRGGLLLSSSDFSLYYFIQFIEIIVWGMAAIGGLAVIAFVMFAVFLHSRKTKMEG
ncbi:polysaccharide deacetylase family protein [Bacillus sp. B190/17]|uniref:Polysaccharide deacetylase family protein n=1 Tax=Bacillus lumedeiriae TaxID=3058829 RepID=A0ABW8IAC7_9BACI